MELLILPAQNWFFQRTFPLKLAAKNREEIPRQEENSRKIHKQDIRNMNREDLLPWKRKLQGKSF